MVSIVVSKEARKDLVSIRAYIRDELCNPDSAKRIIKEIKKKIISLSELPDRGTPLDALITVHTDFRYLVCERYVVFYLSSQTSVEIVRILHERQDYLGALFLK
ncbi:MAG: type II toxin-antitoxin system RelE/ParE family toxin [Clostridia bacterium]